VAHQYTAIDKAANDLLYKKGVAARALEDLVEKPSCGIYPALAEKRRQKAACVLTVERRKPERCVTDPT